MKPDLAGRVGLFGGAFDPIHNGHLAIARRSVEQFGLSRVLLIPTGTPPETEEKDVSCREDRFAMAAAAAAGEPNVSVSRVEIDRPGPSYTIDTLRAIKDDCPEGICFIVGADRLSQIASWKEPAAILALAPIIVAPRGDVPDARFDSAPFDEASVFLLDMPKVDISSTFVRRRVLEGEPISEWVPTEVADYIEEHGLYRESRKAKDP